MPYLIKGPRVVTGAGGIESISLCQLYSKARLSGSDRCHIVFGRVVAPPAAKHSGRVRVFREAEGEVKSTKSG